MIPKKTTRQIVQGKARKGTGKPSKEEKKKKTDAAPETAAIPDEQRARERVVWPPWAIAVIGLATAVFAVCMALLVMITRQEALEQPPQIQDGQAIVSIRVNSIITRQVIPGDVVRIYGEDSKPVPQLQYVLVYGVDADGLLLILDEEQAAALLNLGVEEPEVVLVVHGNRNRAQELIELQRQINDPQIWIKVPAMVAISRGESEKILCQTDIQPAEAELPQLQWESSNPQIAAVNNGWVTGNGSGEAVISVTCGDVTALCTVVVVVPLEHILLNSQDIAIAVGESFGLAAAPVPEDATDFAVVWESQDPEVAAVAEDGTVTGVSMGTTVITAACGEVTVSCGVQVGVHAEMIQVDPVAVLMYVGQVYSPEIRTSPAANVIDVPVFTTSNAEVVTVAQDGTLTAVAPGSATVTVTMGTASASCLVTVVAPDIPTAPNE